MRPVRLGSAGRVAGTAGLVAVLTLPGGAASAYRAGHNPADLRISVLSSRADLVSGGDALVRVDGVRRAGAVRVRLNGADVTRAFAIRPNGAYEGLVTGLRLGRNDLRATAPGTRARGAAITLTDHPWSTRSTPAAAGRRSRTTATRARSRASGRPERR